MIDEIKRDEKSMGMKTLQDIDLSDNENAPWNSKAYDRLRQAAIEWIKSLEDSECAACRESHEFVFGEGNVITDKKGLKEWIIHFFNIAKEDLK